MQDELAALRRNLERLGHHISENARRSIGLQSYAWFRERLRQRVTALHDLIDTIRGELERAGEKRRLDDEGWEGLEAGFAALDVLFRELEEAHDGHPELLEHLRTLEATLRPARLLARLRELQRDALDAVEQEKAGTRQRLPPTQRTMDRRRFVRGLLGVGVAAAAASLTPGVLKALLPEPGKEGTRQPGPVHWTSGIYVQLGAFSTREHAQDACAEFARHAAPCAPYGTTDGVGPWKVLFPQAFDDLMDALRIAQQLKGQIGNEVGVVQLDAGERKTVWLKTLADEISEEQERIAANPPVLHGTRKEYWDWMHRCIATYRTRRGEHVSWSLAWAIMTIESHFDPKARSAAGAEGLMQLMPRMWRYFHGRSRFFPEHGRHRCDVYDWRQNIDAGIHLLTYLCQKYPPGTHALPDLSREDIITMAYNCGETILNKALRDGVLEQGELPKETVDYLAKRRDEEPNIKRGLPFPNP